MWLSTNRGRATSTSEGLDSSCDSNSSTCAHRWIHSRSRLGRAGGAPTRARSELIKNTSPSHGPLTDWPYSIRLTRAPSFDEDLVLTWSVAWWEDRLVVTADVARGDGMVLAEAVPAELPPLVSRSKLFAELERALRFFRSSMDLIKRGVCE